MDHKRYHLHRRNRIIVIGISLFLMLLGFMDSVPLVTFLGLLVVNLYGFLLMASDKTNAKRSGTRIPESSFFMLAAFMGAVGVWIGMLAFRHKTAHPKFVIGIPLLFGVNLVFFLKWMFTIVQ